MKFTRVCFATLLFLAVSVPHSLGHGDVHERIEKLDRLIAASPDNPGLYKQRGSLWMVDENPVSALADFERALELAPDDLDTQLLQAGAFEKAGEADQAKNITADILERFPGNIEALLIRARSLAAINEREESVAAYAAAIEQMPHPSPDLFLEQARVSASAGADGIRAAIGILDHGVERLGAIVSLEAAALDYEIAIDDTDAALVRLDTLIGLPGRSEQWLVRKAELLETLDRHDEAAALFQQANERIDALPDRLKRAPAVADLKRRSEQSVREAQ